MSVGPPTAFSRPVTAEDWKTELGGRPAWPKKIPALVFLMAIILVPIGIVTIAEAGGGYWVAGYVTGIVTVPLIAVGALRAVYQIIENTDLDPLIAFVGYSALVVAVSIGCAIWAFG